MVHYLWVMEAMNQHLHSLHHNMILQMVNVRLHYRFIKNKQNRNSKTFKNKRQTVFICAKGWLYYWSAIHKKRGWGYKAKTSIQFPIYWLLVWVFGAWWLVTLKSKSLYPFAKWLICNFAWLAHWYIVWICNWTIMLFRCECKFGTLCKQ